MEIYHSAVNGFMEACISSNVRPFVSGTSFQTNKTVMPHINENMKNVPEIKDFKRKLRLCPNSSKLASKFAC